MRLPVHAGGYDDIDYVEAIAPEEAPASPTEADILDILEAMSAHYHEHHADIVKWSWKLFCKKWVRLIEWSMKEEDRKETEQSERKRKEIFREHERRMMSEGR